MSLPASKTTDINQRGIWEKPVALGIYKLNYLALTPFLVPTSAVTIDWAAGTDIRTEQKDVVEAKLSIEIKEDIADARRKEAAVTGTELNSKLTVLRIGNNGTSCFRKDQNRT